MADPTDRRRHLAPAVGWIAVILPLTLVLMSVVLSPASNWTARTTLAGFCILATARPDAALLVTTAFLEFGIILSHLAGVPSLRVTEVLVVASLAGYCGWVLWHGRPGRGALTGWLSLPIASTRDRGHGICRGLAVGLSGAGWIPLDVSSGAVPVPEPRLFCPTW